MKQAPKEEASSVKLKLIIQSGSSNVYHLLSTKLKVLVCKKVVGPNSALEAIKGGITMSKYVVM